MHTLLYICAVGSAIVGYAALFLGLGLPVLRILGRRHVDGWAMGIAPWLGWGLALAVLQLWHLALPVDGYALALIGALGIAGLAISWRDLVSGVKQGRFFSPANVALTIVCAMWIANQTTTQPGHPDSALYHLTAVRWAAEYPIVPGLGNLEGRLAFNNSHFLYVALLDAGLFTGRSHHLASGIPLFLAMMRSVLAIRSLVCLREQPLAQSVFDALLLAPLIVYAMGVYGCSPSPDVGVYLLGLVVSSELIRLTSQSAASGGRVPLLVLVLLGAAGITVKLSFVAFGPTACLIAWAFAVERGYVSWRSRGLPLCIVMIAILFLVPWVIRGIILSGYPVYPSLACGFPVEWRIPAGKVTLMSEWIRSWARQPNLAPAEVLGNWRWLWPWFNRVLRSDFAVTVPLVLAFVVAPLIMFLGSEASWRRWFGLAWLALLAPLANLVFWFITAPDPRFAGASFWAIGAGAVALACRRIPRPTVVLLVSCIGLLLFAGNVDPFEFLRQWRKDIRPAKQGHVEPRRTDSGLEVLVPVPGSDCWDAPLPCAPRFNPGLRLRVPGDLASGFLPPSQTDSR